MCVCERVTHTRIPEGRRLLGLGALEGTPLLADWQNYLSCYKTASGEVHETYGIMGAENGLSYSNGEFADAARRLDVAPRRLHPVVCISANTLLVFVDTHGEEVVHLCPAAVAPSELLAIDVRRQALKGVAAAVLVR